MSNAIKPRERQHPRNSNLVRKKSKYQQINFRRYEGGLLLKLNNLSQMFSREEGLYHECAATFPMMLSSSVNRVVVLGGGDGLTVRNVLDFTELKG